MVQDPHPPLPAEMSQVCPIFSEALTIQSMSDFLLACLQKDEAQRPTAKELLSHPWIVKALETIVTPDSISLIHVAQELMEEYH